MPAAAVARRTQADRTATTRAALLDATIDCIVERGWSGTTTTEIAQRAGVSRGAQLHHFPTKAELVVAAVEHLYARRVDEFRSAMATVPSGPGRLEAAIDVLWGFVQGPTFVAWIELQLAARTDDALRETLLVAELRTREWTTDAFTEAFPAEAAAVGELATTFAFALLNGLALQHLAGNDMGVDAEAVVDVLKLIAQTFLGGNP